MTDVRYIQALDDRIASLRKDLASEIKKKNEALAQSNRYKRGYDLWMQMQNLVKDNEIVRDAWNEFYVILALAIEQNQLDEINKCPTKNNTLIYYET